MTSIVPSCITRTFEVVDVPVGAHKKKGFAGDVSTAGGVRIPSARLQSNRKNQTY